MLKLSQIEKEILDLLLTAEPGLVANRLKIKRQKVYSAKHQFKKQVQNAQEFLSVAKSKYAPLLQKRLKTPRIVPDEEPLFCEQGESRT